MKHNELLPFTGSFPRLRSTNVEFIGPRYGELNIPIGEDTVEVVDKIRKEIEWLQILAYMLSLRDGETP